MIVLSDEEYIKIGKFIESHLLSKQPKDYSNVIDWILNHPHEYREIDGIGLASLSVKVVASVHVGRPIESQPHGQ